MKYMKIKKTLIVLALLIAAILRLWNLGIIPPSLTPDEASLGYNAYSILKTGRDEYGKFLPVIFKSFGDYKPGLYVYLTVPFVAIFGLNEFAVRFPSALFGILSVYLIFLIFKKLFENEKLAIVALFVAAANPWLIYFSRGAWEVNVAFTLLLAALFFFLRGLKDNKYLMYSSIFFALTLLCYQGAKLSSGIVLFLLLGIYFKKFIKLPPKKLIMAGIAGLAISLPIFLSFGKGQTGRLEVFSVFSYRRPEAYLQTFLDQGSEKLGSLNYYLFHSEALNLTRGILGRYFNHFSGRFLFFEGDFANPRHSAPNSGMFLLSDIAFILTGLAVVLRKKMDKKYLFIILWLILSPLPSVLSRDQVHAVRSLCMVVPLIAIASFGYLAVFNYFKKIGFRLVVGVFVAGAFVYFIDSYFVHLSKHDSKLWEYGYKEVVQTVSQIQSKYKIIKVQQSFAQPYIYFLFYQKYDPAKYQKTAELVVADSVYDVGYVTKIDNIHFVPIDWSINRGESGTLFVADTVRIPPEDSKDEKYFDVIKEIKYLNDRDMAFRIIGIK